MRIFLLLSTLLLLQCNYSAPAEQKRNIIKHSSNLIHYNGRVNITDTATIFYWAGSSATVRFIGSKLKVVMEDQFGENFFDVIIDNDSIKVIYPKKGKFIYVLAKNLDLDTHTVTIFKRNEYMQGKTWFYSFSSDSNGYFLDVPKNKYCIEFYGNSITAGLANLDPKGKNFNPKFEDNYFSYAAITARNINADYYCIARSGIGLTVSWMDIIMPELFYRLDPEDSLSQWGFEKIKPDIIVINLFQNDYWLTKRPDNPQYKRRFGKSIPDSTFFINAYYNFVDTLSKLYPNAKIICTLGPMSAVKNSLPWKGYIKAAVKKLNNPNTYTFFFPYFVKQKHPTKDDHKKMAQMLTKFIQQNILARK